MSLGLILVILLVIFLFGGFSGRFGGYGYGFGHGGVRRYLEVDELIEPDQDQLVHIQVFALEWLIQKLRGQIGQAWVIAQHAVTQLLSEGALGKRQCGERTGQRRAQRLAVTGNGAEDTDGGAARVYERPPRRTSVRGWA